MRYAKEINAFSDRRFFRAVDGSGIDKHTPSNTDGRDIVLSECGAFSASLRKPAICCEAPILAIPAGDSFDRFMVASGNVHESAI